jgi:hypothetical protein
MLEAKQCDVVHSVEIIITRHDVLDEAKPAVAHVGMGGIQAEALREATGQQQTYPSSLW